MFYTQNILKLFCKKQCLLKSFAAKIKTTKATSSQEVAFGVRE
jgi:hypothetical protein